MILSYLPPCVSIVEINGRASRDPTRSGGEPSEAGAGIMNAR